MKALIINDKDNKTSLSIVLYEKVMNLLLDNNYEISNIEVGKDNLSSCIGCFGCWIKTPGECVIKDIMSDINKNTMSSDIVIYISPIIFGQFSSNMKNVIDRFLPNVLPFFENHNGRTHHPKRYDKYPTKIIIGYGDDITEEEKVTFLDITNNHRTDVKNVFVCLNEEDINKLSENITKCIG